MSETPVKTVDPALVAKANGPSNTFVPFWTVFKAAADEANKSRQVYVEATKSDADAIQTVLSASDDKNVTEWRTFDEKIGAKIAELTAKRDEAKAAITKHAKSLVSTISEDEAAALKAAYLDNRRAADLTGKNILALLKGDEAAFSAGVEHYGVTQIIGLSRNSQTVGATDIVRKRLASATVNGQPFADSKGKVSFTNLSQHLKVDGSILRDAAAKAANVTSVRDIPAGTTVAFDVISDGKTHKVTISTPDTSENETAPNETPAENVENENETTESE